MHGGPSSLTGSWVFWVLLGALHTWLGGSRLAGHALSRNTGKFTVDYIDVR